MLAWNSDQSKAATYFRILIIDIKEVNLSANKQVTSTITLLSSSLFW